MRHASIRALYSYWHLLAAGRAAPARSEIDPKAIARELGDLFILDGDLETFAFRLAGSRLAHAIGRDITGTAFLSIFDGASLKTAQDMLDLTAHSAEPALIGLRDASIAIARKPSVQETPFDRLARMFAKETRRAEPGEPPAERRRAFEGHGEMLLLPLSHRGRVGARVIGALALFNPPQIERTQPIEFAITGTRVLGQHAMPREALGLVAGHQAEQVLSRHGHLAVLRGGRSE